MRSIIIIFLASLLGFHALAQDSLRQGWKVGVVRAGLSSPLSNQQNNGKLGLTVGLFYELAATNWLRVIPELNITQKGGAHLRFESPTVKDDIKIYSIDVPLLFRFKINKKFAVLAGPQVSGNFSMKDALVAPSAGAQEIYIFRENNLLSGAIKNRVTDGGAPGHLINLAAVAGINYQLSKILQLDLRYELGLTPVTSRSSSSTTQPGILRGNVLSFCLGICLPVKRYKSVHPPEWYKNQHLNNENRAD